MIGVTPLVQIGRLDNGFVLMALRPEGPTGLVATTRDEVLAFVGAELDAIVARGKPPATPVDPNPHAENMRSIAEALGVPVASVRNGVKEQLGISPFLTTDEDEPEKKKLDLGWRPEP